MDQVVGQALSVFQRIQEDEAAAMSIETAARLRLTPVSTPATRLISSEKARRNGARRRKVGGLRSAAG
jgi:hypothetical protein